MFRDRRHAGGVLAASLEHLAGRDDIVVLALPRGGVPVAFEVARTLRAPLDVFLVRKLGLPGQEELAMGAIASGGIRVLNESLVRMAGVPTFTIDRVTEEERRELERREALYRNGRAPVAVAGKVAVLVDDGMATGATMKAAIEALRHKLPARIVVAVPIGDASSCDDLRPLVDEVVCAATPDPFDGVGRWYEDFSQTSDAEVIELLERAGTAAPPVVPKRDVAPRRTVDWPW